MSTVHRPFYRFDVESLADMTDGEVLTAIETIESWQSAHPHDRTLDSAWRTLRNEHDYRTFRRNV